MNNNEFLSVLKDSFVTFLKTSSRSNKKLKILHGAIAKDLTERLGNQFNVQSLDLQDGREQKIKGRYFDKMVDITISSEDKVLAGIAVKFVMQNYSQNSNNYFENMLGETANIRCNKIPYFQIFVIPEIIPYYDNKQDIKTWEQFSETNVHKYIELSKDSIETFLHTPTKVLLIVLKLPEAPQTIKNKEDYKNYYLNLGELNLEVASNFNSRFNDVVIYNDYESFINKVKYCVLFNSNIPMRDEVLCR